ncbi:uncharacterized protein [Choristoneura fumiferana]|uniref:uncharacterized protein n=1 Tax=Choristoneura fumiferana TaxID=7141 RepID=UPI003D15CB91
MPHWCACAAWQPLDRHDPLHKEIGTLLANYINDATAELRKHCLPRKLNVIERVQRLLPDAKNSDEERELKIEQWVVPRSKYYKAKVIMNPGDAVFEATVRYYSKLDYFAASEQDISRLNSYANESACLTSKHQALRKFCYCR